MPFFVIKKGLVLLEWKYFPTPKILDPIFLGAATFITAVFSFS
ncbi:hypothetical protein [Companilactobacillus crustorum]|nr:hypothetical protein [Companilactobacillus crustorum]